MNDLKSQEVMAPGMLTAALEKFDGENYHLWRGKAKMVLAMQDLWEIVSGIEQRPPDAATDATADVRENTRRQQHLFDRRSQKALAIIGLALRDDIFASQGIADAVSAAEAWQKLARSYANRGLGSRLLLKQRFAQMSMKESEDAITFLNAVKSTALELAACGDAISDADIAIKLLMGLPDSWRPLVMAVEAREEQELSVQFVESLILRERSRRQAAGIAFNFDSEAFVVQPKTVPTTFASTDIKPTFSGKRCYFCGKIGHPVRFCRKKANKNNHIRSTQQLSSAKVALSDDFVFTAERENVPITNWLIDSGASEHMCLDQSLFWSYQPVKDMHVCIGNGVRLTVAGKGSIRLRIKVNREYKVLRLDDVLHVPQLTHNLFAVCKATTKACTITFRETRCEIAIGATTFLLGIRHGNSYQLVGELMTPGVAAAPTEDINQSGSAGKTQPDKVERPRLNPSPPAPCDAFKQCDNSRSTGSSAHIALSILNEQNPWKNATSRDNAEHWTTAVKRKAHHPLLRLVKQPAAPPQLQHMAQMPKNAMKPNLTNGALRHYGCYDADLGEDRNARRFPSGGCSQLSLTARATTALPGSNARRATPG